MASDAIERVLGGSPISVASRLVLLSILVGVVLSVIGLDPLNVLTSIETLAQRLYAMGFDTVRFVWRYFLLGAVIVVPVWILMRLVRHR